MQVGVGRQVHLDVGALGAAEGREVIVVRERFSHLRGTDVERGHPVRFQPDAHGECAAAENLRALDTRDRGQTRLDDARQVIGDLVRLQNIRGEAEIGGGELRIGRLDIDDRDFGFGREIAAHLIDLRADLRKRFVRIVVQLQPSRDGGNTLRTFRLRGNRCRPRRRLRAPAGW